MKSLGKTLKELRDVSGFTLRQVEEVTEISNAYLSQLENDKIKKPSANCLYKLAKFYNVEIDLLLEASGLIQEQSANLKLHTILGQKLTTEEEKAVAEYLAYLRYRKKRGL